MKKLLNYVCLPVLLLTFTMGFAQQTKNLPAKKGIFDQLDTRVDNMGYWMKMAEKGLTPYNPHIPLTPAIFKGTRIAAHGVLTMNSPDVPVTTLTNVTESENSVFIDPNNADYLLNSNNSTSWSGSSVGSVYGANYFHSANAGIGWTGTPNGAGGSNSGDPTTAIGLNGREYVNFISSSSGQGIAFSDDGASWTTATIAPNPGSLADKNHMWIDNKSTSPYEGNLYTAWTDFGGTDDTQIKISRSINDGVTWSTPVMLSAAILAGSHNQGVNIQTGPNGEVYAAWAVYDGWPTDETAIGFTKSTNGGVSYQAGTRIISNIRGIRTTGVSKNHRVNSFPVMAVDISGGPNNGNIYIVWTNVGTPGINTGTNKSVYIIGSTNGGTTWSTPVRVNQGPNVNGRETYFPWISCDPVTGVLSLVFYDDRNVSSTQCEVFAAYSTDAGNTWTDFPVSDVAFTPSPISGLASSYMGDYLGITSLSGKVYPCWTDNRGGIYMTYVSPFELGLNAGFIANNTTICTGSGVTFSDVSTGPPTSWTWNFPGGTPGSFIGKIPPAITYSAPGTYDVSLTVSDGVTTDTETKTGYITVKNVIANFTGTPTAVVVENSVTFTDNSSCSPTTWAWSFPGGTPSTFNGQTPPSITYSTLGTYDVTLTVTKPGGTDTKTRTGYITVTPPVFNMTNGSVTTCTGDFYDSGGPSGSYQNNENFTETFYPSAPGSMMRFTFNSFSTESGYDYLKIYDGINTAATLIGSYNGTTGPGTVTATNAAGALTFKFTSDVSVTPAGWAATINCYNPYSPPVADFSASSLNPQVAQTVTFTDLSANGPTSWSWSFSPATVTYVGGTSASSQNPQVRFSAIGPYAVTLTATNSYGSDSETKTNYINVTGPVFNITNGTVTTCMGNFYDSGGPSGTYQNNETIVETFYPSTAGAMIRFTFSSFITEAGYDTLTVYNGVNSLAPIIGKIHGTSSPEIITASNLSGALTFRFHSDTYVNLAGWAATISCVTGVVNDPATISATAASHSRINLGWTKNSSSNDVMIAWSPTGTFGTPVDGTVYSPGETITSGGTVLYLGSLTSFIHTPLNPGTSYYYKAFSYNASNNYSSGVTANATTLCSVTLPFTENFASATLPNCWTKQISGIGVTDKWKVSNSANAGEVAYEMKSTWQSVNPGIIRLVTPPLNTTGVSQLNLSFKHMLDAYAEGCTLRIQSSADGVTWTNESWSVLSTPINIGPETVNTTVLNNLNSSNTLIAFTMEGDLYQYDYWYLDAVSVSYNCANIYQVGISISCTANNVCSGTMINFTATPTNGGPAPAYQWKVNGNNIGTNNSSFDYIPANNDAVTCVLTSNSLCISGNPATSNSLMMTVNPILPVSVSVATSANPVDAGTLVTFTATPVNGGASPGYQWKVNNANAGDNNNSYVYVPIDGDMVSCVLTSGATCVSGNPATSDPVTMIVTGVPSIRNVNNINVTGTQCFDATQTIVVAGDPTTFTVQNGGIATLVAGQNILLYPGTMVVPGGYLLGYIAPGGPYCVAPAKASIFERSKEKTLKPGENFFHIYPNPTNGKFTLALNGYVPAEKIIVEIYNAKGENIKSSEIFNEMKHEFSLSGKSAGLYLVKVTSGNQSGSCRIVKVD